MRIILIVMLALAGCATSPQEVVDQGSRHSGSIGKPPQDAARCIARNAEYTSGSMITNINAIDGGRHELIVRSTIEITTTLSVWRFTASGSGSTFEAWVTPSLLVSHEAHIKRVRGDC